MKNSLKKQLESQKKREKEEQILQELLCSSRLVKTDFPLMNNNSLAIIGNGFDVAHGIPSRYYDFRDKAKGSVRDVLELFIDVEDVWADFENNLAYLDREKVLWNMWNEKYLNGVLDEEDDDFSAADFFMSVEDGGWAITTIINDLPIVFRRWINSLKITDCVPRFNLRNDSRFLTFNYTETLETVYGIVKENIKYIHGDRRDKECNLVLGHGHDTEAVFDEWWERNKNRSEFQPYLYGRRGRRFKNDNPVYLAYFLEDDAKGNWHSQTNYDYIENCVRMIEGYYDDSAKKTADVIKRNRGYFNELSSVEDIVTIGHSLSEVDMPYFVEIARHVSKNTMWHLGFHSLRDYKRIDQFIMELGLDTSKVSVFRI